MFLLKNIDCRYSLEPPHWEDQNIDCGYSLELPQWGGSNEYLQSMFLSSNKKNNVHPCKPQFYYIKVGFKGSKLYRYVFVMISIFSIWIPLTAQVKKSMKFHPNFTKILLKFKWNFIGKIL